MKKILIIDNYDSFVYNLVQYLDETEQCDISIVLNDKVSLEASLSYDGVLISPGPGVPETAGKLMTIIEEIKYSLPILGICLGHQALATSFGAKLKILEQPLHGHRSDLKFRNGEHVLLKGINLPVEVGRYHSWVVDQFGLPKDLIVSSTDEEGNIMSFYHRHLPIHAFQFHPESYISNCGRKIIENWVNSL